MPTRAGWAVGVLAIAALAGGRLVGSIQLYVVGATAVALLVVAALSTALAWRRLGLGWLQCHRTIRPWRVHAGEVAFVELAAANHATHRTPGCVLVDSVGRRRRALLNLAPLAPHQQVASTYQLPTSSRGLLPIGPLRARVTDPCGLMSATRQLDDVVELLVYPAIERLPPTPAAHGGGGGSKGIADPATGDDFHALRSYQQGDDLRLVHWPTAARLDELVVRRNEELHQEHTVVVLDTNAAVHTPSSFELCVSAAASVLAAGASRGDLLTLATTDGGTHPITTSTDADPLLDLLATVAPTPGTPGTAAQPNQLAHLHDGYALVVLTTAAGTPDLPGWLVSQGGERSRGASRGLVVQFDPTSWSAASATGTGTGTGTGIDRPSPPVTTGAAGNRWDTATVTDVLPFATVWSLWATGSVPRPPASGPGAHPVGASARWGAQ